MDVGGRFKDQLEQAEEYARIIAQAQDGGRFPRIGVGGRGVLQVFLSELRARDAAIKSLEARVAKLEREAVRKQDMPENWGG